MKQKVFENSIIKRHPFYTHTECKSTLNDIACKDYGEGSFFNKEIKAIDVDNYERYILRPPSLRHTVDAAIGIADYDGKKLTSERIQMIELKMDVHSIGTIVYDEYSQKVSYSTGILRGDIPLDDVVYFVYSDDFLAQARRGLSSIKEEHNDAKRWKAISTLTFKDEIKNQNEIVPVSSPQYDMAGAIQNFQEAINNNDIDSIIEQFDAWKTKYYKAYSMNDIQIADDIRGGLNKMMSAMERAGGDIKECASAFKDEVPDLFS